MSQLIGQLERAVRVLEACPEFVLFVPEVRVNIVHAPEHVADPGQVAGIDGRITVVGGMPKAAGPVRLGVSDHMARLVIEAQRFDPTIRAGLNFRWNESIHDFVQEHCAAHGLTLGCIDRAVEPPEHTGRDRSSIPWKVRHLVERYGKVPRVCYETRGWGKEPLFFLLGPDPAGVAELATELARGYTRRQACPD